MFCLPVKRVCWLLRISKIGMKKEGSALKCPCTYFGRSFIDTRAVVRGFERFVTAMPMGNRCDEASRPGDRNVSFLPAFALKENTH